MNWKLSITQFSPGSYFSLFSQTFFLSPLFRTTLQPVFIASYETPSVSLVRNNK